MTTDGASRLLREVLATQSHAQSAEQPRLASSAMATDLPTPAPASKTKAPESPAAYQSLIVSKSHSREPGWCSRHFSTAMANKSRERGSPSKSTAGSPALETSELVPLGAFNARRTRAIQRRVLERGLDVVIQSVAHEHGIVKVGLAIHRRMRARARGIGVVHGQSARGALDQRGHVGRRCEGHVGEVHDEGALP